MTRPAIDTFILGATGYVAGELLRILAGHPVLRLAGALSSSRAGEPVEEVFPHLRSSWPGAVLGDPGSLDAGLGPDREIAVFSALPHGEGAARLAGLLSAAEACGTRLHLVDLSADFRLGSAEEWTRVYREPHGAPALVDRFTCGLPDLEIETPRGPIAHPGCFTTAVTLAAAPFQATGLAKPRITVTGVTGATGAGRTPTATTHLPERGSNMFAYKPLQHRHRAEMERLLARLGGEPPRVLFVPHSGPFSRGIHATLHLELTRDASSEELREIARAYYRARPFVSVLDEPPRLKDVVATNRCHLSVDVEGRDAVVVSVIDNLTKGAAGGAVQWMNRLLDLSPETGLEFSAPGWT